MKQFFCTIFLFIGLFFSLYGQNDIENNEILIEPAKKLENPNAFFVAPFNLFDFQNPNIQIGYERFVAKKWSLQIEGAIIIPHCVLHYITDWSDGIKQCPYISKGFRVKGSVKYIVMNKRIIKLYVSPELFYYRNKSGTARDFIISDLNFEYSSDVIKKADRITQFFYNDEEKMGINFKVGIKILLGKHFFMEPHFGLGVAYRNVIQTGKENPNDKLNGGLSAYKDDSINHDTSSLWIFDKAALNKWVPTIPFNFKIGFRF
ncbi:MAG: hypothetical protein FWH36_00545 [Lentimicrobiaceae bacterium]|nr:hypothetical protein [Lentimicrobiaceae bacterium]